MQDALEATARRLRLAAGLLLATLAAFAATAPAASAACSVPPDPAQLACVAVVATHGTNPDGTVSPPGVLPTFVSYDVTVTNQAKRTVTHVTLSNAAAEGRGTVVSATTPSPGTCTPDGARCVLGNLPSGARATATITVQTPQAGQIDFTTTLSFDESFNDGPAADPKQDTDTATATTLVKAVSGEAASLVPSNQAVQLDTGSGVTTPADQTIGHAHVPATQHDPFTASLKEETASIPCPKKVICRAGNVLHAEIPGTFSPGLEFALQWSTSLVPKQQSTKNFAVLHTDCLQGCAIEVISQQCSSSTPPDTELPCLTGVEQIGNEWRATLHSKKNGYMR